MTPMIPSKMPTRRTFLKSSAALAATSLVAANAHAQGGDELKVGLIGCGNRGTGAAEQALKADRNVKLYAMADAFEDKLNSSLARLRGNRELEGKINVADDRKHVGFDGYQRV